MADEEKLHVTKVSFKRLKLERDRLVLVNKILTAEVSRLNNELKLADWKNRKLKQALSKKRPDDSGNNQVSK
jgi:hypothetical protein